MSKTLNQISIKVWETLRLDIESRNCDKRLIWKVWTSQGLNVPFDVFKTLTSSESIRRCRQKLQNVDGKFLPTNVDVANRRLQHEVRMKNYFSYKVSAQ